MNFSPLACRLPSISAFLLFSQCRFCLLLALQKTFLVYYLRLCLSMFVCACIFSQDIAVVSRYHLCLCMFVQYAKMMKYYLSSIHSFFFSRNPLGILMRNDFAWKNFCPQDFLMRYFPKNHDFRFKLSNVLKYIKMSSLPSTRPTNIYISSLIFPEIHEVNTLFKPPWHQHQYCNFHITQSRNIAKLSSGEHNANLSNAFNRTSHPSKRFLHVYFSVVSSE